MTSNKRSWIVIAVIGLALVGFAALAQMGPPGGPGQQGPMGPGQGQGQGQGGGPLSGFGCPMMGGAMGGFFPGFVAQNPDQAAQAVQQYLTATWRNPDLAVREVMEFSNHFYVQVVERSTGIGAMELLVDRITGTVHPEPGPNMMWNTKYSPMGGMGHMGGWGWGRPAQAPTAEMPISPEQARRFAQQALDLYLPGAVAAEEVTPFYGYYTLHYERDGQVVGMLSVNGFTGQVWFHNWHGAFLGERTF